MYVRSPIVRILWQALLSLSILIKCDVLHALHNGIGDGIQIGDILSKSPCVTGRILQGYGVKHMGF